MIRNVHLILSIFIALLMLSCEKNDKSGDSPVYPDYGCLKTGNYWIYQRFIVDSNGVATPQEVFDSCYVEKDTIVGGISFSKVVRPVYLPSYSPAYELLRDSLHYIVAPGGKILFSSQDFSSVFYSYAHLYQNGDTVYHVSMKMEDHAEVVITPAGSFSTLNCKSTYVLNPQFLPSPNPRFIHKRFARGVGLVVETLPFFASQPYTTERRLVRYSVQSGKVQ